MKKLRICACAGIMALICMLTYSFLQHFTVADSPLLDMLDWETMEMTDKDGNSSSLLAGQNTTFQQVHLPLPPDCAGKGRSGRTGSSLDISYTHDRFTVQTALKLL